MSKDEKRLEEIGDIILLDALRTLNGEPSKLTRDEEKRLEREADILLRRIIC